MLIISLLTLHVFLSVCLNVVLDENTWLMPQFYVSVGVCSWSIASGPFLGLVTSETRLYGEHLNAPHVSNSSESHHTSRAVPPHLCSPVRGAKHSY